MIPRAIDFKKFRLFPMALLSVAVVIGAIGVSNTAQAAGAIEQLKAFSTDTQSARGEFTQRIVKRTAKTTPPSTGEFAFARPGKFRWAIKKPFEQLIVADGQKVYIYDKDLEQVTVRPIGEALSATPAALLFGQSDVEKLFNLKETVPRDGMNWLEATPKSKDSAFLKIIIGFKDGLPTALEMHDALGQITLLSLDKWTRNSTGADAFKFTTPAGVEVIEANGLSGKPARQ